MIFKKGEFFNGPGGIALGAKMAKVTDKYGEEYFLEHEWANDIDEAACQTFINNICPDRPDSVITQDVRELEISKNRLSEIDAFTFGFPCNDYSLVGEKKGLSGDYGPLYITSSFYTKRR